MAAVPGLDQHNAGVGDQFGASVGSHADKGIIESLQDQRGHGNVLGPVGTGNAVVVVVRAREAAISRDDLLVKIGARFESCPSRWQCTDPGRVRSCDESA